MNKYFTYKDKPVVIYGDSLGCGNRVIICGRWHMDLDGQLMSFRSVEDAEKKAIQFIDSQTV